MERSSHWTAKKIIAFILLILSALLIIFPWMNVYVSILGQRLTIPRALDYSSPSGYSEFKTEIYEGLSELSWNMAEEGIYMSADQAMSVVELILNGRISPIDAARICSAAASILAKMKACMVKEYQDYYGTDKIVADVIIDVADKAAVAAVIMWVLIIGGAIALAFALYLLIKDKKYSAIPYFCFSALLLIVFVVVTFKANDGIRRYVGSMSEVAYLLGLTAATRYLRISAFSTLAFPEYSVLFLRQARLCFPCCKRRENAGQKLSRRQAGIAAHAADTMKGRSAQTAAGIGTEEQRKRRRRYIPATPQGTRDLWTQTQRPLTKRAAA